jgi:predicted nucleotidyltransferase
MYGVYYYHRWTRPIRKRKFSELKLRKDERTAITTFSRRLKRAMGKKLVRVLLYGSKARGTARKDSDIDIFVLVNKNSSKAMHTVAKIADDVYWEYNVDLSPVTYDLYEESVNKALGSPFFLAVYRYGVKI